VPGSADPADLRPASQRAMRARVRDAVARAWDAAVAAGRLARPDDPTPAISVDIERPANPAFGDFATNLAMKLARPLRRSPIEIAEAIAAELHGGAGGDLIASAEAARPGFVNVRLSDAAYEDLMAAIVADPSSWGRIGAVNPRRVNVEFVSANPTGPLHIGNARGAFVGDLLSRVLEAGGQQVTREYYFNDFGAQVGKLGASVIASRAGEPIPEDGYHGDYVHDLARDVPAETAAAAVSAGPDGSDMVGRWASERVRSGIEASLARLGVRFDVWKSESSLHREGWVDRAIERLRTAGHAYEHEGALWFRSTAFGDDKDRVLIRSNGDPTYFAADVGYIVEKLSRGFDHLIYVWGVDHHGYIARTRGAAEAMGFDPARVQVLLTGWVSILRGGQVVAMSKRAGDIYLLDTLLDEIGNDAARWFFASRGANLDIEVDVELARRQSSDNPVYYVQYAHARIASILRKAAEAGLAPSAAIGGLLAGKPEADLARVVARFPEVVEDAVQAEETQGITAYATELATQFHAFYRDARVVDAAEPARSAARLALATATRVTLANALALLGISAPESM
jgi:arginyl-tRNA synthetase